MYSVALRRYLHILNWRLRQVEKVWWVSAEDLIINVWMYAEPALCRNCIYMLMAESTWCRNCLRYPHICLPRRCTMSVCRASKCLSSGVYLSLRAPHARVDANEVDEVWNLPCAGTASNYTFVWWNLPSVGTAHEYNASLLACGVCELRCYRQRTKHQPVWDYKWKEWDLVYVILLYVYCKDALVQLSYSTFVVLCFVKQKRNACCLVSLF